MRTLEDLEKFVEQEAAAEGPAAQAELAAERLRFRLARQLAEARKAQGLTQVELARRSGVPQSEISKVEGGANATEMTLFRIAFGLGQELVLSGPRKASAAAGRATRAVAARPGKGRRVSAASSAKGRKPAKARAAAEELHAT